MNTDVKGLIYGASLLSIMISIYMFATGKRDTGIFIGLWAPTFLGLGTFFSINSDLDKLPELTAK